MSFFKFRKGGDETPPPPPPISVEMLRRRAKHRLIGAAVLVLAGVIGFPILFDSQPRPVDLDIAIEVPDKSQVRPMAALPAMGVQTQSSGVIEEMDATPAPVPAHMPAPASAPRSAVPAPTATPAPPALATSTKPRAEKPEPARLSEKPADKSPERSTAQATERLDEAAKVRALLEGKAPAVASAADEGRFVVQVGAFSDAAKAREVRSKLESAGMTTYTQVIESKEGKRIRVRVGPFSSRAQADKVADRVKKLGLSAGILAL